MKKSSPDTGNVNNISKKVRFVPQGRLQKLFEQHGNQFFKWNFLPFLNHNDRESLRSSCKVLKNFIPEPTFVYFKTTCGFPSSEARARLETNTGNVEARGNQRNGGNTESVADELQSNVMKICSTHYAFAALKNNGKVVTWGNRECGGDMSSVSSELQSGVVEIFSTRAAFAALTQDGKVVSWGDPEYGGDSSSLSKDLQCGVTQVLGDRWAFAALKSNGKVVSWGHPIYGGDSSSLSEDLQSGVTQVVGGRFAFAALKSNGKVVSWGLPRLGGDSSHFSSLNSGVVKIEAIHDGCGFRATKHDENVVEWP